MKTKVFYYCFTAFPELKYGFLRGELELFFKRNDVQIYMAKCLQTNAPQ